MKKMALLIIISLLILSSIQISALALTHSTSMTINETLQLSNPVIKVNEDYTQIDLIDAQSTIQNSGKPSIPIFTKTYYLPFGSHVLSADVTLSSIQQYFLSKPIIPVSSPQPLYLDQQTITSIDSETYSSFTPYPSQDFDIRIGTGLDHNQHITILTVICYPIKYYPQDNFITSAKQVQITIQYSSPQHPFFPQTNDDDLLIITPTIFTQAVQPLSAHKQTHGLNTQITTDTEIYAQSPGRDYEEKIKYYIKEMVETQGTNYVLIVGGVLQIPMRYTAIDVWNEEFLPTDLYYADLYGAQGEFCSWDSNNNNLFGEYDWDLGPIDQVDLYADVYIGRLPCTTIDEVTTMVNKIIIYETTTKEQNWFDRLLVMAGDTFPNHGNIEGEFVTSKIIDERPEFSPIRIWTSQGNYNPITINLAISGGAGFISYSGHGYEQGFGTSPPNVEKRIEYWSPYLLGLFNQNKFPIVFFDACSTSKLDFNMEGFAEYYPLTSILMKAIQGQDYDPDEHFPCFSWQIMKKPHTGAIATIGATRVAFTHVNSGGIFGGAGYLNYQFFMAYEPGITVAEMLTSAQNSYINYVGKDCVTLEEFILLGDPSLRTGGY